MTSPDHLPDVVTGQLREVDASIRLDLALIVVAGLIVRLYLIHRYPIVFGVDTILRLANANRIVLSYQLPLLQAAIHYLSVISSGPLPVRYFIALVGSAAGAGFYLMMSNLAPRSVALEASLLFVTSPFILAHSVVPYQEILMVAGLVFAFHFTFAKRWGVASLSLGAACLTRYEAWLACPALAAAYLKERQLGPRPLLAAALLFGWAPVAWAAYNRGVTPPGGFAVEWSLDPDRFVRWAYLGGVALRNSPLPTLLLGGLGGWVFFRRRLFDTGAYQTLLAFLALFLVGVLFSAHGTGDEPERFVTAREAHIPLVGITVLAGLGLGLLPRFQFALTALSVGTGLWMADRFVQRATSEPHVALSYEVARYLDRNVGAGERVVVLARGVSAEDYLARLERLHGPPAVKNGLRLLRTLETSPIDYQRILVHSRLGKDQLRSYATLSLGRFADSAAVKTPVQDRPPVERPQWIVVWSDFAPTNAIEARLAAETLSGRPRQVFQQERAWVQVLSLRDGSP